jgi:hypothetical protein
MANFDTSTAKARSVRDAVNVLQNVRAAYEAMKVVQGLLARYQANTDPVFNAAVNALHTAPERTELADMLLDVNALVIDWETNHALAIQQ